MRQLRRYLSYRPEDEARIFRLLDYASAGSPGPGPIHLLIQSADELRFFWDSEQAGWIRPGLPPLRMMTGPIQHFRSAIWQAWQSKVATDLCKRKGFRGGFGVDIYGSHYFRRLNENNNVICLQEVHGKDEFLQAIQVWAPRFM